VLNLLEIPLFCVGFSLEWALKRSPEEGGSQCGEFEQRVSAGQLFAANELIGLFDQQSAHLDGNGALKDWTQT
jgi:hypothetical protein